MALNLEKLMATNADLIERMEAEDWDISYDKRADMLYVHGTIPKESMYHYVGNEGFMVRINQDEKIFGFAVENYRAFASRHTDVKWIFMQVTDPVLYHIVKVVAQAVRKVDQLKEMAEYLSSVAAYSGIARKAT